MPVPKLFLPFIVILLFVSHYSYSQSNDTPEYFLYEDSSKQLTGETAFHLFEQGNFTQTEKNELNKGFTRSVFWLAYINKYNLPADSLVLYIGHHHINRIHFFFVSDSNVKQQWITGDYFPFSQRPVNATGFYFPINKKGLYLARIDKSNESLQLSFHLVTKAAALAEEANNKTVMALFTGMILLLVIFGIYLFVISGDKVYVYYILYISSGWLWVLSNAGYGFQYLWPDLPWFASKARPVFAMAPLFFSMIFLVRYIGGIRNKKILSFIKIMNAVLLACIISILFFNEEGYQSSWWLYIQYFIPLVSLLYIFMILAILVVASVKGNKLAMFYLAAVLTLLLLGILQVSFSLGSFHRFGKFFNTYWLSIGYVVEAIILTAGLVYRFNQYRVDKEKLLIEMNKRQTDNTRIMMEVQEAERSQVANQLHDVAGSLLSAAKLNLSSLREKGLVINDKAVAQLEKTEEAVGLVSDMVRNLSHALSPVMLEQVGFKTSLEKIIAIFNASGKININLLVMGFEKYEPSLNNYYTVLYSIIYELLNNIVKHSGASNALLQVAEYDDAFTLLVEDNGAGLEVDQQDQKKGLGMAGIQSKINYFKGSFALDKNKPEGLIVTIEIPKPHDAKESSAGR